MASVLRAKSPAVCLAQAEGLGVGNAYQCKGQRPGRLEFVGVERNIW